MIRNAVKGDPMPTSFTDLLKRAEAANLRIRNSPKQEHVKWLFDQACRFSNNEVNNVDRLRKYLETFFIGVIDWELEPYEAWMIGGRSIGSYIVRIEVDEIHATVFFRLK